MPVLTDPILKELAIPEGITVSLENNELDVRGQKGQISRQFTHPAVRLEVEKDKIRIVSDSERRDVKSIVGTWAAHIRNMLISVTKGWTISLKVVYSHFPIKLTVEGDKVLIHNFLGERRPRTAKIIGHAKVDIKGADVVITGINKEDVGQTAANIERATHITGRDRRIFSDGVWITSKCLPGG